jgi:hypothetical protein
MRCDPVENDVNFTSNSYAPTKKRKLIQLTKNMEKGEFAFK